jgi:hypothetical protein
VIAALRRHAWAPGVVGAALGVGALGRLVLQDGLDARGVAMALVGAALLVVYAWLDQPEAEAAETSRLAGHAAGGLLVVGLGLAVAGFVQAGVRAADTTWDVTSRATFTVSPQTLAVLQALDRDVRIDGFFRHGTAEERSFERMARGLEAPRLTVALHDPLREPLLAERLGVTVEAGQVVVSSGEKRALLSERRDEAALLNAILRVTSDRDHRLCWLSGHGEASPDDDDDDRSLRTAVLALEGQDFEVMPVSTLTGPIDPSCEAVIVARPALDPTPDELDRLWAWVAGGGRMLLLLEPDTAPALSAGLARFGLGLGADVVLDPDPSRRMSGVEDPSVQVFPRDAWQPHPVSDGLAGAVVFGVLRQVRPLDDVPGVGAWGLLYTSGQAWAETDRTGAMVADLGEDAGELAVVAWSEVTDPAALGVAAPTLKPGGRVVVIGDASFATNQLIDMGSNLELFLHTATWLVGEDERLAPRTGPGGGSIELTRSELLVVMLLALVVGPGVGVVAAARLAWRSRRA